MTAKAQRRSGDTAAQGLDPYVVDQELIRLQAGIRRARKLAQFNLIRLGELNRPDVAVDDLGLPMSVETALTEVASELLRTNHLLLAAETSLSACHERTLRLRIVASTSNDERE
ncbi:hypothetical protein [Jongsikchunia kroppenstedtii]|uniref:hypothetical protein n=1 Tax=Jongsikchunia kroppenstedtii TaxID=1121721 RepID=UPI0012DC7BCE|nr:hypothetical protein [Jongsikchunia kroppenstedtii]